MELTRKYRIKVDDGKFIPEIMNGDCWSPMKLYEGISFKTEEEAENFIRRRHREWLEYAKNHYEGIAKEFELGPEPDERKQTPKETKKNPEKETAIWLNGDDYEYEFAYCSNCSRMEHAGWYTHSEAQEKIPSFHEEYRYCPGCGAKMTGGSYIPKKTNRGRTKNGRKLG